MKVGSAAPQGFVWGAILGFIGSGIAAIAINYWGAKAGDWLSFLGAMFGSMITVGGAMLVVQVQDDLKAVRYRELLLELLGDIERAADRAAKEELGEKRDDFRLFETCESLNRKVAAARDARQWITPDNAAMVRAFGYIGELPDIQSPTARSLQSDRTAIPMIVADIRTYVRAARRELQS